MSKEEQKVSNKLCHKCFKRIVKLNILTYYVTTPNLFTVQQLMFVLMTVVDNDQLIDFVRFKRLMNRYTFLYFIFVVNSCYTEY